jgi:hypothetical protein
MSRRPVSCLVLLLLLLLLLAAGAARAEAPRILALMQDELRVYVQRGAALEELGAQDLRPHLARKDYGKHCGLITTPRSIVVAATGALVVLDRSFRNPRVWRPKAGRGIGAAAALGEHLLVAVNGELWVLDPRLRPVGKVKLPTGSFPKDAHDILVEGKRAYLLDNIMLPRFVFIVDLSTVRSPRVVGKLKVEGIYLHLKAQWLAPGADRWVVIQGTAGRGGSTETALFLPRRPPLRVLGRQDLWQRIYRQPATGQKNDLEILAVTRGRPVHAVVRRGEATSLARLSTSRTRVDAQGLVRLDELALQLASEKIRRFVKRSRRDARWRLARRGKHVVVGGDGALFLLQLEGGEARVVASFSTLASFERGSFSLSPFLALELL